MAQRAKKPPTFEERLAALEAVVEALESDELTLEASLERYKQGVEHLQACRALLDAAEERLAELVEVDGRVEERPMRVGDDGLEDDE